MPLNKPIMSNRWEYLKILNQIWLDEKRNLLLFGFFTCLYINHHMLLNAKTSLGEEQ